MPDEVVKRPRGRPPGSKTMVVAKPRPMDLSAPVNSVGTVAEVLEQNKGSFSNLLGKWMSPEKFAQLVISGFQRNPRLLQCSSESLVKFALDCAQSGLAPCHKRGMAAVPFRNGKTGKVEITAIPTYQGLLDIVWRSGKLKDIRVEVVRAGEEFDYVRGDDAKIVHRGYTNGEMVFVYAIANLMNGGVQRCLMTAEDVAKVRARSRAANDGPWCTDTESMWKKSCLKRLLNLLEQPLGDEISKVSDIIDQEFDYDDQPTVTTLSADAIFAKKEEPPKEVEVEPEPQKPIAQDPLDGLRMNVIDKINALNEAKKFAKLPPGFDEMDEGQLKQLIEFLSKRLTSP